MGIAWFLIGFAIVIVQSRTTYIQIAGLTIVLLIFRRRAIGSMILAVPAVLFMLALITVLEVKIPGRLTEEVSFSFLADHFAAIFGVGGEQGGGVAAAAQGVPLRLNWWTELYERITDDTAYLLTGLGYGIPLTNFVNELGIITREPHNSYISVVARIGLIGFAAWLWMQVGLFAAAARAYYRLRSEAARTFLLMTIAFGTLLLVEAFGEDAMEKPYHAIPYYT
jgi:O-antigen ligase